MKQTCLWLSLSVVALLAIGQAWSFDDKKDSSDSKTGPRLRGQLPQNYRKLSLSEEQVQKIYKIQAEYDDKVRALEEQIKAMKAEEKKKIEGVLTPAQLARLKEILKEKASDK